MRYRNLLCVISMLFTSLSVFAHDDLVEKIIVVRHAEKQVADLGQLNCKGLNRSLRLPAYFRGHFKKPDYIFAPNPSVLNAGFSYVRPLATIEPTAISLGLPVGTQIGYDHPNRLVKQLLKEKYHNSTIIVAWEHKNIVKMAQDFLHHFNNHHPVPNWKEDDYNTVFVFTIDWGKNPASLNFSVKNEGLSNISGVCPFNAN